MAGKSGSGSQGAGASGQDENWINGLWDNSANPQYVSKEIVSISNDWYNDNLTQEDLEKSVELQYDYFNTIPEPRRTEIVKDVVQSSIVAGELLNPYEKGTVLSQPFTNSSGIEEVILSVGNGRSVVIPIHVLEGRGLTWSDVMDGKAANIVDEFF